MNVLIVDDENIAREILKNCCSHFPEINIVGSCSNAIEAKGILNSSKVNILFIDINMPVIDGLSFIKTLKNRPKVILTTAYKEYAVEAFDLEVTDYLVKPFSFERFMVALDKTRETTPMIVTEKQEEDSHIFIRAEGKIYKVFFNDIIYGEANGNYTLIVTTDLTLKSPMTFTAFENLLPPEDFDRIHRSFIINRSKITYIEGNRIFLGTYEIPLGQNYRDAFLKKLGL